MHLLFRFRCAHVRVSERMDTDVFYYSDGNLMDHSKTKNDENTVSHVD